LTFVATTKKRPLMMKVSYCVANTDDDDSKTTSQANNKQQFYCVWQGNESNYGHLSWNLTAGDKQTERKKGATTFTNFQRPNTTLFTAKGFENIISMFKSTFVVLNEETQFSK
jgi:hypothetical protein